MKNTKRIASLLLALVMVFALATTAAADEADTGYTITIKQPVEGYVYEAYQIFDGDLSADGKLSNIVWGAGIDAAKEADLMAALQDMVAFADCDTAAEVAEALAKDTTKDNEVAKAFAELVGEYLVAEGIEAKYADEKYTIEVDDAGYYLVLNTEIPSATEEEREGVYTRYILQVVGNVTVSHKGEVPSVDKVILEGDEKVDANEASIGDTITYEFTGTMPSNIADYDTYFYKFTDTLSAGLTYADNLSVTVNGINVTKYFYADETDNTLVVGIQDLLALENLEDFPEITAATTVVVKYDAVLNENAEIGSETGNKNEVDLEYSNNPNDDGKGTEDEPEEPGDEEPKPENPTGVTPKDEVVTYTTELLIIKTDEKGESLTGATFKIEGEGVNIVIVTREVFVEDENGTYYLLKDGTYTQTAPTLDDPTTPNVDENNTDAYVSINTKYSRQQQADVIDTTEGVEVEVEVDATGRLIFTGLGAGTYTISETVVPEGYNSIAPFEIVINWDEENGFTYEGTDYMDVNQNGQFDEGDVYLAQVTVVNKPGSTLPETGGIGTTLFYAAGALMVLAAVVLLVTKRRMNYAD